MKQLMEVITRVWSGGVVGVLTASIVCRRLGITSPSTGLLVLGLGFLVGTVVALFSGASLDE